MGEIVSSIEYGVTATLALVCVVMSIPFRVAGFLWEMAALSFAEGQRSYGDFITRVRELT